jgi:alkylhydroperoxidase family enzyme
MAPRIKLLHLDELEGDAKSAYDDFAANGPSGTIDPNTSLGALSEVLLYNPGVFRGNSALGNSLSSSLEIPARDREILTLRVAWRCRSSVEWSNHTPKAHKAGLTEAEIEQITVGPDAGGWTPREQAILRLVDELHDTSTVSDETWAQLTEHYQVNDLVALPMLVGQFHTVAYTFNMLGVPDPAPSRGGLDSR